MPSSIQLFIRVPKHISSEVIFDEISEMKVCKVCSVKIVRVNKRHNAAIVTIHYWYKGTKDIRDNLNRGEAMRIPTIGNYFVAYKYAPRTTRAAVHTEQDSDSIERSLDADDSDFDLESIGDKLYRREVEEKEMHSYILSSHCDDDRH